MSMKREGGVQGELMVTWSELPRGNVPLLGETRLSDVALV